MSCIIRHLALVAIVGGGAAVATAQPADRPLPRRVGFEGGLGLYGGEINCEDQTGSFCDGVTEAGGFDLHATYMFRPSLGVTVDVWPMIHREDRWTFTHTVATVGVKWRPAPIFGFTLGLGSAQARLRYEGLVDLDSRTEVAPAVLFAGSLAIVRGRRFAIDLEARAGVGFYGEDKDGDGNPDIVGRNLGLGASVTWF